MQLIESIIFVIVIFIIAYIFIIRRFIFGREKFRCLRCGKCCKLRVDLSDEDIKRIKMAGKRDFIEGKNHLKRINGFCKFLELKEGKSSCSIYKIRPAICREYPRIKRKILPDSRDLRCKTSDRLI